MWLLSVITITSVSVVVQALLKLPALSGFPLQSKSVVAVDRYESLQKQPKHSLRGAKCMFCDKSNIVNPFSGGKRSSLLRHSDHDDTNRPAAGSFPVPRSTDIALPSILDGTVSRSSSIARGSSTQSGADGSFMYPGAIKPSSEPVIDS